jgi:sugar phosphate isomerase/epimerase
MKLSLVLSTQAAQFQAVALRGDLAANMARIAGWGYLGVELTIRDPKLVDGHELLRLAQANGLAIPAIGTGQAWGEEGLSYTDPEPAIRAAAVARTLEHIPFAAQTGAVIIIGLLRGIVQPGVTQAQAMDWLVAALRACCRQAASHGVRIAIEPINRYETTLINNTTQGLDLLRLVGAENLGLLLDTFHMNIEEPDILASIMRCGSHIAHFHVADSNRWYPGAGHLDFRAILAALQATGYEGYVSGEFMPQPDALESAQRAISALQSCLPPAA